MRYWFMVLTMIILFTCKMAAQSEWNHYTSVDNIGEIEFYNNKAYVTNSGGLLVIDLDSGEEFLLNRNDGLLGQGTREVEILSNGEMWLTSYEDKGLIYFDSETFTDYSQPEFNLNLTDVTGLVATDEIVWFTVKKINEDPYNQKLFSMSNGVLTDHSTDFPDYFWDYCLDNEENLTIAVQNSIWQYDGENFSSEIEIPTLFEYSGLVVHNIYVDNENTIWIEISEGFTTGYYEVPKFLYSYKNEQWDTFPSPTNHNNILHFIEPTSGDLTFSATNLQFEANRPITVDSIYKLHPDIPFSNSMILKSKAKDSDWITTSVLDKPQIYRIQEVDTSRYAHNKSYQNYRYGDLQTNCDGQLISLNDQNRMQFYIDDKWTNQSIGSFDEDCNITDLVLNPYTCELWAYSFKSNCFSLWNINSDERVETDLLPDDFCRSISFDKEGNVYVISSGRLSKITSTGATEFLNDSSAPTNPTHVYYASNDILWVVDRPQGNKYNIYWLKDGEWKFKEGTSEPFNYLRITPFEDSDGHIWLFDGETLIEYNQSEWISHQVPFLTNNSEIQKIVEDIEGSLWLATSLDGLIKFDGSSSQNHNIDNSEVVSNNIIDIEIAQDSIMWLKYQYGVSKMKINLTSNIEEAQKSNEKSPYFSLYPNPTHDGFTLSFPHAEKRKIEIFNISGQLVYSTQTESKSVEVSRLMSNVLEEGCYWVKASGASGIAVEKVVVY